MKALAEVAKDALDLPSNQRFMLARILLNVSESADVSDPSVEEASRKHGVRGGQIHDYLHAIAARITTDRQIRCPRLSTLGP